MKKITYVYQGGRKNHMDSSTNGAKDFYYGATLFNKLEFEVNILEFENNSKKFNKFIHKLEYYISKLISLPFNFSKIVSRENFKVLKSSNYAFFINENTALSSLPMLYFLRKKHDLKVSVFVMGLFSKNIKYKSFVWLHEITIKTLVKNVDNLLFLGLEEFNYASRKFDEFEKFKYFPFCIDFKFWSKNPNKISKKNQILFVGNDTNRDFKMLYDIAAKMQKYNFVIITENNEQEFNNLKNVKLINGKWADEKISDTNLRNIFQESELTIIPLKNSLQPSGQSVTLQSLASGTPVVISRTDGFWDKNSFINGEHILFVESSKIEDWEQVINSTLEQKDLLLSLSKKGQELVSKRYNQKTLEQNLQKLIDY